LPRGKRRIGDGLYVGASGASSAVGIAPAGGCLFVVSGTMMISKTLRIPKF
jgi:hypothetical protein